MIASNLPDLLLKQADKNPNKVAIEYKLKRIDPYRTISWNHLNTIVLEAAYGLIELGLKKGDNVAILSNTRFEWAVCDLAILSCGGVTVPIYPTLLDHMVSYILNDSECQIVFLEDKGQLQKIRSQWDLLTYIKYAIVIEDLGDLPEHESRIISLRDLQDKGKLNFSKDPYLIKKHTEELSKDDTATIIYTSGTTGNPKGVILTHKNILSVVSVLPEVLPLFPNDKFLSFLPLSHVFERVGGLYYSLSVGNTICYCSNADQIGAALKESKATLMLVVPRLLEKIYSKITAELEKLDGLKKNLFKYAFNISREVLELKQKNNKSISLIFKLLQLSVLDKIIFKKLRKKFAPNLKYFVSGGAPLSREIAEFFCIIGIPILEGYGLTETSAPATVNRPSRLKLGTVGEPIPNVEIKIASDGEILIKGPTVFKGYFKNENATKDVFREGWFCTGDVGVIDEEGFLKITDRKKDIIKNSGGKIIAPQNIENSIKTSKYISNVVVIGDKRKYLSALITLDPAYVIEYANEKKVIYKDGIIELSNNKTIKKLIEEEIKLKTAEFADYEQIRKITILPNEFSLESSEITPTLKVKRKFVEEKYKDLINAMYPSE